jgi:hypothetical protein
MSAKMMKIDIKKIDPNPYRDFNLYPVTEEQVAELMQALKDTRDFGVIAVRPSPEGDGRYQQVFGHHRLEAMKRLKYKEVDCKVEDIDEDQLIKEMVLENSTQQGNNAAAQLDSVGAIIRRLGYLVLISNNLAEFEEMMGTSPGSGRSALFDSQKAFESARGRIVNGTGIGQDLIQKYAPSLKRKQIELALATLKDSGHMAEILGEVKAEVEAEVEAAEEAERERAEEARKAAEQRQKAEAAAKVAAEKAAVAAQKAAASRRVAAEAEAKAAADRAKKMAEARKVAAQEEAERRARSQANIAKQRRVAAEAETARKEFEKRARGLNPSVLHMLRNDEHLTVFRKVVTSEKGQRWFPESEQPKLVTEMLKAVAAAHPRGVVTGEGIQTFLNQEIAKRDASYRKVLEEAEQRKNAERDTLRVKSLFDDLRASTKQVNDALFKFVQFADKNPNLMPYILSVADDLGFINNLRALRAYLDKADAVLVQGKSQITKGVTVNVEKVIN